jgi:hypothetical protein
VPPSAPTRATTYPPVKRKKHGPGPLIPDSFGGGPKASTRTLPAVRLFKRRTAVGTYPALFDDHETGMFSNHQYNQNNSMATLSWLETTSEHQGTIITPRYSHAVVPHHYSNHLTEAKAKEDDDEGEEAKMQEGSAIRHHKNCAVQSLYAAPDGNGSHEREKTLTFPTLRGKEDDEGDAGEPQPRRLRMRTSNPILRSSNLFQSFASSDKM